MEQKTFALQPAIEQTALRLYKTHPKAAIRYLQETSLVRASIALKTARNLTKNVKSMVYR